MRRSRPPVSARNGRCPALEEERVRARAQQDAWVAGGKAGHADRLSQRVAERAAPRGAEVVGPGRGNRNAARWELFAKAHAVARERQRGPGGVRSVRAVAHGCVPSEVVSSRARCRAAPREQDTSGGMFTGVPPDDAVSERCFRRGMHEFFAGSGPGGVARCFGSWPRRQLSRVTARLPGRAVTDRPCEIAIGSSVVSESPIAVERLSRPCNTGRAAGTTEGSHGCGVPAFVRTICLAARSERSSPMRHRGSFDREERREHSDETRAGSPANCEMMRADVEARPLAPEHRVPPGTRQEPG